MNDRSVAKPNVLDLVSVTEAAILTRMHPDTLRRWIRNGRLPAWGRRGYLRVRLEDVLAPVQQSKES